jgi:hypothetical protein
MFIAKMSLPRRTFLRGVGAAVALPLLDAMVPALSALSQTAANPVGRLGFIYIPNGAVMDSWTPESEGPNFTLSPTLRPLDAFRDRVTVVSGLGHKQAESLGDGNGDHSRATTTWLSGVHPRRTEGADVRNGTTADQLAARELGKHTQLASLELALEANHLVGNCDIGYSCVYINTISWRTPTTPLPMENNPRVVFERLFGDGGSGSYRLAQLKKDRSILDSVLQDVVRLDKTLGADDRTTVGHYLDAIRDVERRIVRAEQQSAGSTLSLPDRPLGIPETFEEHIKLMFDLQVLAYQADLTRVTSFLLGRELSQRTYAQIGVTDPHHSISHHQDNPDKIAKLAKINAYHVEMLAYFLEKLRSTPDGDGSLLDHSMLLYGGGISDGNLHNHSPLPIVLVGGGNGRLKGGRHLRYPKDTPMANLLLNVLDRVGVPTEALGDSTRGLAHLAGL